VAPRISGLDLHFFLHPTIPRHVQLESIVVLSAIDARRANTIIVGIWFPEALFFKVKLIHILQIVFWKSFSRQYHSKIR
jgi:cbb3-type cytochrome oxidase subunit 1